ncbi:MAG: OHCU decarboxylase, partial [Phormidesmis priestleyi]
MPPADQLALVQAHPELATRAKMAAASVQEQSSTGLNQLEAAEYERFQALNQAYLEKFGFPFVMAVKGQDKASILAAFEGRVGNEKGEEMARSLQEISKIAGFRLQALIPAE